MAHNDESSQRFWGEFHGPNIGYVEEQYELYKEDPQSVDPSLRDLFDQHGAPVWLNSSTTTVQQGSTATSINDVKKITSTVKLVEAIRRFGHLEADIYPVSIEEERKSELLNPETYGLTEADLREIPAAWVWENAPAGVDNALDVVRELRKFYTGTITFEYDHVDSDEERDWLSNYIESGKARLNLSDEEKKQLLDRLVNVEGFEGFLQRTFVGQKRFSIEGLESMVPMLDHIVKYAIEDKVENIMMGMAHRGRLSVLAHVLGKPIDKIFSEFHYSPNKELIPSEGSRGINYGWTGDVKYHFGAVRDVKDGDETKITITLAHNPSHLEFVNPVVEGFARAAQDDRSESGYPKQDVNKAIPVLVHGDAAFIGEGVVAETLNLTNLPGYRTGGTLHIIANNLLGYTTDQQDGRSTRYASDLAKGFEIPVIHVNADDPIACVSAIKLAYDYRMKFNKDILIDLVGYRRYGHNEMDEPRVTQPKLYSLIDKHPTVSNIFAKELQEKGIVTEEEFKQMVDNVQTNLKAIYDSMKESDIENVECDEMPDALNQDLEKYETAVSMETLEQLNEGLFERPEGFNENKKLQRILKRRRDALQDGNLVDWGAGEALTYASILNEGTPIRLTGQDSERGTFAHRHAVLNDAVTNEKYSIFHNSTANASFDIRNSPLSEAAVLGFEYGYSVQSPSTLVLWEAQFGDFANAAQVIFDQFISAARAKWGDKSNMVLLLPHGYEGGGPEHSSARLERFLQMAAENNWIVAYPTSSAQFFHIMRRQAALRDKEEARPLILMTYKSGLIRSQRIASDAKEFTEGKFQALRIQPNLDLNKKAKRLLVGTGKVMIDIEEAIEGSEENYEWLSAVRVEQIYPFPTKELEKVIAELPNLEEIVWVQEEPKNMGAWKFVDDYLRELLKPGQKLRYIGRPDRSSPATGDPNVHKAEQEKIVKEAINPTLGGESK